MSKPCLGFDHGVHLLWISPAIKALVRNLSAFTTLFAPGKSWDNVRSTAAPYTESRLTHLVRNKCVGFPVVEQILWSHFIIKNFANMSCMKNKEYVFLLINIFISTVLLPENLRTYFELSAQAWILYKAPQWNTRYPNSCPERIKLKMHWGCGPRPLFAGLIQRRWTPWSKPKHGFDNYHNKDNFITSIRKE